MTAAALRPVAFLLLMLGFGFRLDSTWQVPAAVLLVVGAVLAALGSITGRSAFVPPGDTR